MAEPRHIYEAALQLADAAGIPRNSPPQRADANGDPLPLIVINSRTLDEHVSEVIAALRRASESS